MHVHVCAFLLHSQLVTMCAWACDYAYLCFEVSLWLCMHVHVCISMLCSQCNYECMSMWLCTFMLYRQLVTMHACACDYAHLCYAASLELCTQELELCTFMPCSHLVTTHACAMCMWLCTSTPCSQFVTLHAWACEYACMCMWLFTSMLCCQLVTMYAWAYEYVHLCHAFSYANDSLVVSGPLNGLIQQTIPSWEKYLVFATYLVFYWITQ